MRNWIRKTNEERAGDLRRGLSPCVRGLIVVVIESIGFTLGQRIGGAQVFGAFGFFLAVTPLNAIRPSADEQAQSPMRVLVVDDQLLYAEAISLLLKLQEGIEVVGIAGDGQEAISRAAELEPDLVLMDIEMPRLDGISATRWIRRRLPSTRVVVMTALTGDEYVARALRAGAEACVAKFSHAGDLLEAIENVI